mmetsp:Transcript_43958/g.95707  ORF Transcript_43958/g.95707 Transcript_43958/m.95707 type:complete len:231 (-) Transcript_43958:979-1671(-)
MLQCHCKHGAVSEAEHVGKGLAEGHAGVDDDVLCSQHKDASQADGQGEDDALIWGSWVKLDAVLKVLLHRTHPLIDPVDVHLHASQHVCQASRVRLLDDELPETLRLVKLVRLVAAKLFLSLAAHGRCFLLHIILLAATLVLLIGHHFLVSLCPCLFLLLLLLQLIIAFFPRPLTLYLGLCAHGDDEISRGHLLDPVHCGDARGHEVSEGLGSRQGRLHLLDVRLLRGSD